MVAFINSLQKLPWGSGTAFLFDAIRQAKVQKRMDFSSDSR